MAAYTNHTDSNDPLNPLRYACLFFGWSILPTIEGKVVLVKVAAFEFREHKLEANTGGTNKSAG